jgi:hypothetical protein
MPSFAKILDLCSLLSGELADIVFIGGVAVYLHTLRRELAAAPPEASHDADFMISLSDYGILKDEEELTSTPRLAKHQMIVDGVEFDVYVERLNRLVVPYDEVFAHSEVIEGVRVACLEHLLVLKLEALEKRGHSSKGDKDRRDVAKIGLMLGRRTRKSLIRPYARDEHIALLDDLSRSAIFFDLCSRNSHVAKRARTSFTAFAGDVRKA